MGVLNNIYGRITAEENQRTYTMYHFNFYSNNKSAIKIDLNSTSLNYSENKRRI